MTPQDLATPALLIERGVGLALWTEIGWRASVYALAHRESLRMDDER